MARKSSKPEPNLRELLSADVIAALQADFKANGAAVIERLRERSPEKYAELCVRAIAASEPETGGFEACENMTDMGRELLRQIGLHEDAITPSMIEAALAANDEFVARLGKIADGH